MTQLVLIPCSNRKNPDAQAATAQRWDWHDSAPARLGASGRQLLNTRAVLARRIGEAPGWDLGGSEPPPPLLPAVARYSGQLYHAAAMDAWPQQDRQRFSREALIVSGLYGLLTPDEPIRHYNCAMEKPLPGAERIRIKTWWRRQGLGGWLGEYLRDAQITDVYSFLSRAYAEALGGRIVGRTAVLAFGGARVHHVWYGVGTGAGYEQGARLRRFITSGTCRCDLCERRTPV